LLYPIFLNLAKRKCLVVGGGKIAERKVLSLLKSGASVTLVSPKLTPPLQELADRDKIHLIRSEFQKNHLEGFYLVIGATDREEINTCIAGEAERRDILYNIVDVPKQCSFFVPSLVVRGDLLIAISTQGKSPALAKKIRRRLQEDFGEEYKDFLTVMGEIRKQTLRSSLSQSARAILFESLVDSNILELFREGKKEEARARARDMMDKHIGG